MQGWRLNLILCKEEDNFLISFILHPSAFILQKLWGSEKIRRAGRVAEWGQ
jgi:hypothetical protein